MLLNILSSKMVYTETRTRDSFFPNTWNSRLCWQQHVSAWGEQEDRVLQRALGTVAKNTGEFHWAPNQAPTELRALRTRGICLDWRLTRRTLPACPPPACNWKERHSDLVALHQTPEIEAEEDGLIALIAAAAVGVISHPIFSVLSGKKKQQNQR